MAVALLAYNNGEDQDHDKNKNNLAAFPLTPVKNKDDQDKNRK
jgi:hypothetical protein